MSDNAGPFFDAIARAVNVPSSPSSSNIRRERTSRPATTSTAPVLLGDWLTPGTHVNAIGANYEHRRELDLQAVARATIIATDDPEQVRYESSDLAEAVEQGVLSWSKVHALGDVVAGLRPGRGAQEEITLFKSLGVAIEDVALGIRAYEKAMQQSLGRALPDLAG